MKHKWLKISAIVLVFLFFFFTYVESRFERATEFHWGLNFSLLRASELGFDPEILYLDMLTDLKPQKIRLPAYWNLIEPENDRYDFSSVERYLDLAQQYEVEVILTVGRKAPRWPECHEPQWTKELSLKDLQSEELAMIRRTVEEFRNHPAVVMWQVQNEPLFNFGEDCPKLDREFLKQAVEMVRTLDSKPILVTDSGELGRWLPAATAGSDVFGTTMYWIVENDYTGYFKYPLPPAFFRIKAGLVRLFEPTIPIIGVEFQAEPWVPNGILNTDLADQSAIMNSLLFEEYVEFAKQTGIGEHYLWGVEWWYWMAKTHDDWSMWAAAKRLLQTNK